MNNALVTLIRKYETRAKELLDKGIVSGSIYYENAAAAVLALARQ